MSLFSPLPDNATPGDRARRRGMLCLLLALLTTPITILLFSNLHPLWEGILPLEGIAFALAATLFGAILAIVPVVTAFGWLLALWFGVESVYMPRTRHTPTTDIAIVGAGLVAWFSPALMLLVWAILSLFAGHIVFQRPSSDPLLVPDPNAFWKSVGTLLIIASVLAWLAWRYWQGKLRRKHDM
jgi:hypothetical protein